MKKALFNYSFCWLLVCFTTIISNFFPNNRYFFDTLFFIYLIIAFALSIYLCIKIIKYIWLKEWLLLLSIFLSPLLALILLYLTHRTIFPHWIYFQIHKHEYKKQISHEKHHNNHLITKSFPVGSWGFSMTASGDYEIVYDESDKIEKESKINKCDVFEKLDDNFYFINRIVSGCQNK